MNQKNIKIYSFIFLITLLGCSDDSDDPQEFVDSNDLFLELTLEGETLRYGGQIPFSIFNYFTPANDIAYQNFSFISQNDLVEFKKIEAKNGGEEAEEEEESIS